MRRFILCSGIHGDVKSLVRLRRAVERLRPDGVLFVGGALNPSRCYETELTTWGLSRDDARFLEQFFAAAGGWGVFTAVIPGPCDTPLDEFLRLGMNAEVEYPNIHLVHATVVEKDGVAVCGMGGQIAAGRATELDVCSRTLVEYHLRKLWAADPPRKILLLADPPTGVLGGKEGSPLTADLIDSYHPSLCVVCGPTERRGSEHVGSTLVVNPGHLSDGWLAWLDWNRPADECVDFLNLRNGKRREATLRLGTGN